MALTDLFKYSSRSWYDAKMRVASSVRWIRCSFLISSGNSGLMRSSWVVLNKSFRTCRIAGRLVQAFVRGGWTWYFSALSRRQNLAEANTVYPEGQEPSETSSQCVLR
jgi:hypothetical protein